jgi:hypothetical protein
MPWRKRQIRKTTRRTERRKANFQVVVGNIGTVYDGPELKKGLTTYKEYKDMSEAGYGRASDEDVTLFGPNDQIIHEHIPNIKRFD